MTCVKCRKKETENNCDQYGTCFDCSKFKKDLMDRKYLEADTSFFSVEN